MSNLIGQTLLKRYRVDDYIGRGAMADVYKVWDDQRAAYLAMKLLREDLAMDAIFLRRFRREAQALAQLQHPHIVRFYGLEEDDLLAFILMDFIDGTTLQQEIRMVHHPLPLSRVLEVMRPVCSALHFAHRQGLIHCDIKPSNIMTHSKGAILVADFGLAHMTESAATSALLIGGGTFGYMAPEQARGDKPTVRTDIYALGVVLFEMLTGGERPFTGEATDRAGTARENVLWEQLNITTPSPRRWNPEIDDPLEQIVKKCLAVSPAERYSSALELLEDLEAAAQSDRAVAARPLVVMRAASAAATPARRRSWRVPLALSGVALIALLLGFVLRDRLNDLGARETPTAPNAGVVVTDSPTATHTAMPTSTFTATATATHTPTPTLTATATATFTSTPTATRRPIRISRTPTLAGGTLASPTAGTTTVPAPTERPATKPPPAPATPAQP